MRNTHHDLGLSAIGHLDILHSVGAWCAGSVGVGRMQTVGVKDLHPVHVGCRHSIWCHDE